MAKKKKASPKKPDHGKVRHFSPDVLDFDLANPRLSQSDIADEIDEADMIQFLWKEMNVEELALSIGAWGYYEHEPLIAEQNGSRYTVIEGNRRLAAVKILRNRGLQRHIKAVLPKLSAAVAADLEQLPVVVTTAEKVWQHIGFKHVNGPKPWGAIAKAKYIVRVHNEFGVPLEDIPRLIGDTHATVRRLYRGLMVLQQAEDQGLYHLEDRTNKRLFFSHLYTGLSYPGVQEFLGIKESQASAMLTYFALAFLVFALPAGFIAARFRRKRTIIVGLAALTVLFGGAYFTSSLTYLSIMLVAGGIAWALVNVNSLAMVVDIAPQSKLGSYTGLYYFFSMAAAILSPPIVGGLIDLTGYKTMFIITPAFMVLALLCMTRVTKGEALEPTDMDTAMAQVGDTDS